jgi:hypothetical protein
LKILKCYPNKGIAHYEQLWGVKAFTFKDPDGNEINFLEKLK